jgi:polar amino acid transport system substrate-binding protein
MLATLYPGIFTFGTDQPAYPPWYMGDNPASSEGFVTLKSSPAAGVTTVRGLKRLRLGVQVGTTSYTAAAVNGDIPIEVYNADLPTAFAVADELRNGLMVGQLPGAAADAEQLGIVLDKGSALTRCVSRAVDQLDADGALARLAQQWLTDAGKAPVLA